MSSLDVELVPTYDTAGSAKMIKEGRLRNSAAIASKRVSQIYEMEVLAEGIETNPRNFTRFFVISQERANMRNSVKPRLFLEPRMSPGLYMRA